MKLLLAEDDPMVGASIEQGLRLAGFTVDWCRDGRAAELSLQGDHGYSALLLDLGLPKQDGLTVLKKLRQARSDTPVLIITARDAVGDRVAGLNMGADDYLIKPFDLDELIARIRALIRRNAGRARPILELGGLSLDPVAREARLQGRPLALSQREFGLLEVLLEQPNKVYSREEIEERLYGWDEEVSSNAIEVHIHNLRRKIGREWIRNVRGVGYKLVASG
jgi:DNA-binding response OmpR family regulator